MLVYKEQTEHTRGRAWVSLLWRATHEDHETARQMMYAPIPREMVEKVEREDQIKYLSTETALRRISGKLSKMRIGYSA